MIIKTRISYWFISSLSLITFLLVIVFVAVFSLDCMHKHIEIIEI